MEQYVVLKAAGNCAGIILDSSVVERSAVNRNVVGSSPTRGVKKTCKRCLQVFWDLQYRVTLKRESQAFYRTKNLRRKVHSFLLHQNRQ